MGIFTMKKLFVILALSVLTATAAKAQFFFGTQFGVFTNGGSTVSAETTERAATSFNVSLKPSVGYYFTPKLVAGLKLIFTSCSFADNDTGSLPFNIESYAINLLMGNGLERDYMSFKVSPYVRYHVFSMFNDKLKIWAELDGYLGMKYPRDDEHKINTDGRSMIYGIEFHPLVSYDIINNYMIYTALNFASISWDGQAKRSTDLAGEVSTRYTDRFLFQCNPLMAIANAFINIGVMKKF